MADADEERVLFLAPMRRDAAAGREVLARAAEATGPRIDARRHRLTGTQPGRPVWAAAGLARLTQVVGNLLTNAAKYSEEARGWTGPWWRTAGPP